jgi:3-oxoacyl-[acyl-carrier protein] reductase
MTLDTLRGSNCPSCPPTRRDERRQASVKGDDLRGSSKAAVLGLTRAVAEELALPGITVNAVCPGLIDTDMVRGHTTPEQLSAHPGSFPIPRLGRAEGG